MTLNIVLLGVQGVGRSTLIRSLLGPFDEAVATGEERKMPIPYELQLQDREEDLLLWAPESCDSADYSSCEWCKIADGFVVMFAADDVSSFAGADKILTNLHSTYAKQSTPALPLQQQTRPPVCLLQTKMDVKPKVSMTKIAEMTIRQSVTCTVSLSLKANSSKNTNTAVEPLTKLANAIRQQKTKAQSGGDFKPKARSTKPTFKLPNWRKTKLSTTSTVSKSMPPLPKGQPRQPHQTQHDIRLTGERVKLNVGGSLFETFKETITGSAPDSLLAEIISQDSLKSPIDGSFFIDRNPRHFDIILDYLRTQQIAPPSASLPYDSEHLQEILNEAIAYRIQNLITLVHQKLQNERCDYSRREVSIMLCQSKEFQGMFLNGLDVSLLSFRKANLQYARLRKANFRKAGLSLANLTEADLTEADLTEADLSGALLTKATCKNTVLAKANLSGANITNALVIGCNMNRTVFDAVNGAESATARSTKIINTSFTSTTFRSVVFKAVLIEASVFNNCDLEEVHFDSCTITNSDFKNSNLQGARFTNCTFNGPISFSNSSLEHVDLSGIQLVGSQFVNSLLHKAKFIRADLTETNFDCADATGADFSDANLTSATFTDVAVADAVFSNTTFAQTNTFNTNLAQAASLQPANYDVRTSEPTYTVDPSIVVSIKGDSSALITSQRTVRTSETASEPRSATMPHSDDEDEDEEREVFATTMSSMARSAFGNAYGTSSYGFDDDD